MSVPSILDSGTPLGAAHANCHAFRSLPVKPQTGYVAAALNRIEGYPMKKSIVLLLATAAVLSACNTVRGVGKDVQSVGKAVEKSSN